MATYISYLIYVLSALLLILPCYLLWRIKSLLVRTYIVSMLRLAVQLVLVGVYMKWLFVCNSLWIDLLWLVVMSVIVSVIIAGKAGLRLGKIALPVISGVVTSVTVIGIYVLFLLFNGSSVFDARYVIPVAGILLGCVQRISSIALEEYFHGLSNEGQLYEYLLGNGATHLEAVLPFVRRAIEKALKPTLSHLSVAGIVTFPGLFLGQLLGGINPFNAALNTVCIFAASAFAAMASVLLALFVADRGAFDCYGRMRRVLRKR